jgi:NAD(P)-dependent dehydrogenase (short-subunit alcohol dehydrogenase family)
MYKALVTGADRGFGLSISRCLLKLGWTVYAGKYIEEYTLLEKLQEEYERLHIVMLDVGSKETIQAVYDEMRRDIGYLDMIVSNAALMGMTGKDIPKPREERRPPSAPPEEAPQRTDLDHVWRSFKVNALGGLALTGTFKPLLDNGTLKRLCFVSSEVSSISMMNRDRRFAYPMSKSSLNMAVRMLHNDLYGQGYTVRLFHPGWMQRVMLDGTRVEGATVDPDDSAEFAVKYFTEPLIDEHRLVMVDYLGNEWPY